MVCALFGVLVNWYDDTFNSFLVFCTLESDKVAIRITWISHLLNFGGKTSKTNWKIGL